MKRNYIIAGVTSLGLILGAGIGIGIGAYWVGMNQGMAMGAGVQTSGAASPVGTSVSTGSSVPQSIAEGEDATRRHITAGIKAGDVDPATGRKVLYYHDPMVPGNKFDKPAKYLLWI